jgi:hypothetical protein
MSSRRCATNERRTYVGPVLVFAATWGIVAACSGDPGSASDDDHLSAGGSTGNASGGVDTTPAETAAAPTSTGAQGSVSAPGSDTGGVAPATGGAPGATGATGVDVGGSAPSTGGSDIAANTGGSDVVAGTGGSDVAANTGGSDVVAGTGGSDVVAGTGGLGPAAGGRTSGSGGATRGGGGTGFGSGGRFVGSSGGTPATGAAGAPGNNCLDCHTREYLDENVPGRENAPSR